VLFWHFGPFPWELHEKIGLAGLPAAMPVCASRGGQVAKLLPAFEPMKKGFSSRQRVLGLRAAFLALGTLPLKFHEEIGLAGFEPTILAKGD
jgi:hypothetical protein